jgi:G3E family GTPase
MSDTQTAAEQRIPVTVLTGFLGSGKTTLLNKLLRRPELADTAVIINEFGEIGLDHLLVEKSDDEGMVTLNSGCLCCTVRGDLVRTMSELFLKRSKGEVTPFKRMVVETTGLADPAPIVQLLLNNPLLSHFVRLDTVVTTVDAVHGERQLDAHAEAVKQIAIADRLLLTKTDIAAADAVERLRARLARLNPGATLSTVLHGATEPDQLFGAALFDPARKTPDVRRWLKDEAYEDGAHGAHAAHHHAHGSAVHDSAVHSFCMIFEHQLDWMMVNDWLGELRRSNGENLLRVKGILNLAGEPAPVAIHGIHHVFHPPVLLNAWTDADRRSRIVFITRDLAREQVEAGWRRVCASERAVG